VSTHVPPPPFGDRRQEQQVGAAEISDLGFRIWDFVFVKLSDYSRFSNSTGELHDTKFEIRAAEISDLGFRIWDFVFVKLSDYSRFSNSTDELHDTKFEIRNPKSEITYCSCTLPLLLIMPPPPPVMTSFPC